jgi:hypothetical protein
MSSTQRKAPQEYSWVKCSGCQQPAILWEPSEKSKYHGRRFLVCPVSYDERDGDCKGFKIDIDDESAKAELELQRKIFDAEEAKTMTRFLAKQPSFVSARQFKAPRQETPKRETPYSRKPNLSLLKELAFSINYLIDQHQGERVTQSEFDDEQ